MPANHQAVLSELVYEGAVEVCERLECKHQIIGNGHHMAQAIAQDVDAAMKVHFLQFPRDIISILPAIQSAVVVHCDKHRASAAGVLEILSSCYNVVRSKLAGLATD